MISNATIEREFFVKTNNEPGVAAQLTKFVNDNNANFNSFWGWSWNNESFFSFFTDNDQQVFDAFDGAGFNHFEQRDVVVFRTDNRAGAAFDISTRVKEADLDFEFFYTTYWTISLLLFFRQTITKKLSAYLAKLISYL